MNERDVWRLRVEAAMCLRNLRSLLTHPSLDLAPREVERYEADCAVLASVLFPPAPETTVPEPSETPF